jgi:trans-2-enoyl-CoA reductase
VVTNQVAVVQSPTLVVIDGSHRAHLIVGYTTGFELAQRISDALTGD